VALSLDAGARVPLYSTAMGYAYLWGISEKERQFFLRAIRKRLGAEFRAINRRLSIAFESLDRQGFCIAEGTYERGMNGVGAPLVLEGGNDVYAVSASAPTFQIQVSRMKADIGPRLVALVNSVQAAVRSEAHQF
jgi:DNA-binding IclR family transcriptional regulator